MQAPSAPSLLRKTAPFLCPRQRSQFCPCGAARRCAVVTPPDAPQPVDISSVSLCRYEHCVLFPSQLAAEHISLRRCSALCVVTPRTRVRPVDICCDSACAPGALRRTPTLRSAYVFLHTRLGRCMKSRLARVCGRSTSAASQHVRPALCAQRPRFAALLSSCAQGSALLIFSASLCQYKCCALFLPQLAAHLSPLRRCSAFCSSSAKRFLSPASGGSHSFAPFGAREDPVRRTAGLLEHVLLHPGFFSLTASE